MPRWTECRPLWRAGGDIARVHVSPARGRPFGRHGGGLLHIRLMSCPALCRWTACTQAEYRWSSLTECELGTASMAKGPEVAPVACGRLRGQRVWREAD